MILIKPQHLASPNYRASQKCTAHLLAGPSKGPVYKAHYVEVNERRASKYPLSALSRSVNTSRSRREWLLKRRQSRW